MSKFGDKGGTGGEGIIVAIAIAIEIGNFQRISNIQHQCPMFKFEDEGRGRGRKRGEGIGERG